MKFLALRCIAFLAMALGIAASSNAQDQPNILFIMTDDHAAHAVGVYGGRLAEVSPTEHIDWLAEEGMVFRNAFVTNSICTPSRATLMTGQYSQANGVLDLGGRLTPEEQILPHLINEAGYETAMIGKWHLKEEPAAYDYYSVLPGQGSYFNPIMRVQGEGDWPDNVVRYAGYDSRHSSDVITDHSLNWLKNRAEKDKPFFLMHHFKGPHDNFENAERFDWMLADTHIPEPASLWDAGEHGSAATEGMGTSIGKRNKRRNMGMHMFVDPDLPDHEYQHESYQRYLKKYLRTVAGVDENIGRLIAHLRETGELDNTVIIYTSDQGFMLGEHDFIDKRWMYEESMRIPLIVRYPGKVEAGSNSFAIVNNTDWAPTLLGLAGVDTPESMHGHSLTPILYNGGEQPTGWRSSTYYRYWMHMAHHDNPAHFGIRTQTHKLIFYYGADYIQPPRFSEPTQPGWELYDLVADPHEMVNVYGRPDYRIITATLKLELQRLRESFDETDEAYPHLQAIVEEWWDQ